MSEPKKRNKLAQYGFNVLVAVDQLGNALLGGDEDETISSRLGKYKRDHPQKSWRYRLAYAVCRVLHVMDRQHCIDSIEEDEGSAAVIRSAPKKSANNESK